MLSEIWLSAELNFVKTFALYFESLRDYVAGLGGPKLHQAQPDLNLEYYGLKTF